MKAHVVIDAGYGDSGKGLMTDYFCSLYDSDRVLNIKVNGVVRQDIQHAS